MQKGNISVGLIVIIVLVIAVGGYFLMQNNQGDEVMTEEENMEEENMEDDAELVNDVGMIENYVTYDGNNFNPSTITISEGQPVTFINNSESQGMWVASAVHPTHEAYSGTSLNEHCGVVGASSFDSCGEIVPGEQWSFTFDQVGEWSFHNHTKAGDTGTVIVE